MENFGEDEINVIRTIFDSFDVEREGRIQINQISSLLHKLGKKDDDMVQLLDGCAKIADASGGLVTFEEIIDIFRAHEKSKIVYIEGTDPKVLEFLRILEEYRVQCEEQGNYLEASRAHKQLGILRKQEERRQQKVIQARHISERQDVQLAHNMQFNEFTKSWERYLGEYDQMAQMYIQQMTERHALVLLRFQNELREELNKKPPRWSKHLLEQRRRQHISARNKQYILAQKLKRESDREEEKEREDREGELAVIFARREAKFRQQQQVELQALLKRIETRRREHIRQREEDTQRLLQRNKNVMAVLEARQAGETQKLFAEIKKKLYSSGILGGGNTTTHNNNNPATTSDAGVGKHPHTTHHTPLTHSTPALPDKARDQHYLGSGGAEDGRTGGGGRTDDPNAHAGFSSSLYASDSFVEADDAT